MLEFNRAVAGIGVASAAGDNLVEQNAAALDTIRNLNEQRAETEQIAVQPAVIGYRYDSAFPLLMRHLVRPGIRGFILAALLGAVISSLAAMLNAASTIFTMDLYREFLRPAASQANLVMIGRLFVVVFTVVGCLVAPLLGHPRFKGIFTYIQEFQGFLSPGVLAVFIFGLFLHRAPRTCGVIGLLISPVCYGLLYWFTPQIAFLNRMAITFAGELVVLGAMTVLAPLEQPVTLPEQKTIPLEGSASAKLWGGIVILLTLTLYWIFW
jgi:SSS family solute:Na+ symporter